MKMKNAIILHGGPSKKEYYDPEAPSMSNAHWIPWLQGQLLKADIAAATPEVPHSFGRNWKTWNREVERFDITPETILVGHSTGSGFFIKYLSIHPKIKVGDKTKNFFDDFEIDPDLVSHTKGVTVFNSDNDQESVQKAVAVIDKSQPHAHKKSKETYKVIKGNLNLFVDDQKHELKEGEELVIEPGQTHWAEGNETWIECYSEPGWTFEDHIMEEEK